MIDASQQGWKITDLYYYLRNKCILCSPRSYINLAFVASHSSTAIAILSKAKYAKECLLLFCSLFSIVQKTYHMLLLAMTISFLFNFYF